MLHVAYRIKQPVLHEAAPCLQSLLSSNTNLLWFTHPCRLPKWQLQTLGVSVLTARICPQPIVWRMSHDCSLTFHFTAITFHQAHSQTLSEWHTEGLDKCADLPACTAFAFVFFEPFPLHQIWSGALQTGAAFIATLGPVCLSEVECRHRRLHR